jgi:hypothetical protein
MVAEMARTLTLGQRRFAEAIVEGKKPIDAYRAAYPGRDTGAYAGRVPPAPAPPGYP